ncbi:MAG: ethanolamine utilization protein EutH [Ruminococcaceae bacterium]|nr:ethanolamine utilization protein EutH [Oscillospiraceae bacterium]
MSFDRVILFIMALFSCLGGLDRIFGNRLGLGKSFEKGLLTVGELALSMIGIMVLAPVIAKLLSPVILPVYSFFGLDPAVFAGSILACDMGGAQLAGQLTADPDMARFGGILVSSMLGVTVSFTIPVAMGSLSAADRADASKGILCGVITIPLGAVAGGLIAGFSPRDVLVNSIPIAVMSLLIALGLWKAEKYLILGFQIFGKFLMAVATVGLVAAGFEWTTDIVLIPGLGSIEASFAVVGEIAIVLTGAFPLMRLITKLLQKPLSRIGRLCGINAASVSGLISTLANSIATFGTLGEMDPKGKIVNMAFAVSAAFVFGDHLAFTAGYASEMLPSMLASKLIAGICAVGVAFFICRKKKDPQEKGQEQDV